MNKPKLVIVLMLIGLALPVIIGCATQDTQPLATAQPNEDTPEFYLPRYAADGSFLFLWFKELQFGWVPLVEDFRYVQTDLLYILAYSPNYGQNEMVVNVTTYHGWENETSYERMESYTLNITGTERTMVGEEVILPSHWEPVVVKVHYLDVEFWITHRTSQAYVLTLPKPLFQVMIEAVLLMGIVFLVLLFCLLVTQFILKRMLAFPKFDPFTNFIVIGLSILPPFWLWFNAFEWLVLNFVPVVCAVFGFIFIWFGLQRLGGDPLRWLLFTIPKQRVREGQIKGALRTWEIDVAKHGKEGNWRYVRVGGVKRAFLNLFGRHQKINFSEPPAWYWEDPDGNYDRVYLSSMTQSPVIKDLTIQFPLIFLPWFFGTIGAAIMTFHQFSIGNVELMWGAVAFTIALLCIGVYVFKFRPHRWGVERSALFIPLESIHAKDITKWWQSEQYRKDTISKLEDLTDKLAVAIAEKASGASATAQRWFHIYHSVLEERLGVGEKDIDKALKETIGRITREDSQPEGARRRDSPTGEGSENPPEE